MGVLAELEKIKDGHVLLGILNILLLIAPGVLILFWFHQNLFLSLDWVKLLLLSSAISAPFVFLNILTGTIERTSSLDLFNNMTLAIWLYGICAFAVMAFCYFLKTGMTQKTFFLFVGIFEFIPLAWKVFKKMKRISREYRATKFQN